MPLKRTLADEGEHLLPNGETQHTRTLPPEEFEHFQQLLDTPGAPDTRIRALVAAEQKQKKPE